MIEHDPSLLTLEISVRGSCEIAGDPEMLRVVFQNILMNAAQATDGKGKIDVTITDRGAQCQVDIVDRGPGIPDDVRQKVFDAFFTTRHRGTGLGLPIARGIIESHGGRIQILAPPEGGTTVAVVLPKAR